jgi:hypothetical protein
MECLTVSDHLALKEKEKFPAAQKPLIFLQKLPCRRRSFCSAKLLRDYTLRCFSQWRGCARHGRGLSPIKSFGKLPCRFIKPFLVFANVMWADINPYITKICIRRMFYKEVFLLER